MRPMISQQNFSDAWTLKNEKRLLVRAFGTDDFAIPSKSGALILPTADLLGSAFTNMKNCTWSNSTWDQYKLLRSNFHYITRSAVWQGFI